MTTAQMDLISALTMLNNLQRFVRLPETNDITLQKQLLNLTLANAMKSRGTAVHKQLTTEYKNKYKDTLEKLIPNSKMELDFCYPFCLQVKKTNPRKNFDKAEFIKQIADQYDISMTELNNIAKDCTKETAASVFFEVLHDEGNNNV